MKLAWRSKKIPFFYKSMNFLSWFIFRFLYKFRVYGQENIISGPAIIAGNHVSYLDPPLVGTACPDEVHYLAKESLFKIPIFGFLIKKINSHPLKGTGGDFAVFKRVINLLEEGKKVILFPEGQRSYDDKLCPIKPGLSLLVSKTKAPVIPVYIFGTFKAWPRKNFLPRIGGTLGCIFGKPIYWDEFESLPKKESQIAFADRLTKDIIDLKKKYQEIQ